MSRLDISSGSSSLRLEVNPQAKLKALVEISRSLGRAVGLDEVLPKLLDSLFAIFPAGRPGAVRAPRAGHGKAGARGRSSIAAPEPGRNGPHQPHASSSG